MQKTIALFLSGIILFSFVAPAGAAGVELLTSSQETSETSGTPIPNPTPPPAPKPQVKNGWNAKKTRYYIKDKAVTGLRKIDGKIYYFSAKGDRSTATKWIRVKGQRYYLKKGVAYTGWHYIGKYKYYFHKDGHLSQDLIADLGAKWKKKNLIVKVNRKTSSVTLYAKDGKKGYTIPVKTMAVSVGKMGTRTKLGTYTMKKSNTYRWRTLMGGVKGQYSTRIDGGFLFHSVLYRRQSNRSLITSSYNYLGTPASHGCVRLQVEDAKIIYDIVRNRNTKVTIFESKSVGPFDKPKLKKIPVGQNYDPTDPAIKAAKKAAKAKK